MTINTNTSTISLQDFGLDATNIIKIKTAILLSTTHQTQERAHMVTYSNSRCVTMTHFPHI